LQTQTRRVAGTDDEEIRHADELQKHLLPSLDIYYTSVVVASGQNDDTKLPPEILDRANQYN
jgi:hypothetical protein